MTDDNSNKTPTDNISETTPATSSKRKFKKTIITKKKLEFVANKQLEPDKTSDKKEQNHLDEMDLETLKTVVDEKRKNLVILKRHE